MKLEDIISQNDDLKTKFCNISSFVKKIIGIVPNYPVFFNTEDKKLDYFDDHGSPHCERVKENVNNFINNFKIELNEMEAFVLLSAIYCHDLGMFKFINTDTEIREKHEQRSCEILADKARSLRIEGMPFLIKNEEDCVKRVIKAHRKKNPLDKKDPCGLGVNLPKIEALLRLGDALDVTKKRTSKAVFEENYSDMSETSQKEWLKKMPIFTVVPFRDEKKIKLWFYGDDDNSDKRREQYVLAEKALDEIKEEIDKVKDPLKEMGLENLSVEIYDAIRDRELFTEPKPPFNLQHHCFHFGKSGEKIGSKVLLRQFFQYYEWVEEIFIRLPRYEDFLNKFENNVAIKKNYLIKGTSRTGKTGLLTYMSKVAYDKKFEIIWINFSHKIVPTFDELYKFLTKKIDIQNLILVFDDIHSTEKIFDVIKKLVENKICVWCACINDEFKKLEKVWEELKDKFKEYSFDEQLSREDIMAYIENKKMNVEDVEVAIEYLFSKNVNLEELDRCYLALEENCRLPENNRKHSMEVLKSISCEVEYIRKEYNGFLEKDRFADKPVKYIENELKKYINDLNEYYDTYQLQQGCNLSEKAIKKYPFQIDIIHLWVLFHNRKMEWGSVRETLNNIIKQENSEEIKAECYLGIFESFLNEFTKDRYKTNSFEQLKKAKENYLDRVHGKETNGKYHYFLARYFEDEWWLQSILEKQSSLNLSYAVNSINKSISLYNYNTASSGYQASHATPWWLYCHKAILLKLWEHPNCEQNIKEYKEMILKEVESSPLKKSVQMYAATSYLLIDDYEALQLFLDKLDRIIKKCFNEKSLSEIHPISEVDNSTFHHIELIFYKDEDKEKRSKYYSLLNSWFHKNID